MGHKQFKAWDKASAAECSFIVLCAGSLIQEEKARKKRKKIVGRVIFHTETSSGHFKDFRASLHPPNIVHILKKK